MAKSIAGEMPCCSACIAIDVDSVLAEEAAAASAMEPRYSLLL